MLPISKRYPTPLPPKGLVFIPRRMGDLTSMHINARRRVGGTRLPVSDDFSL